MPIEAPTLSKPPAPGATPIRVMIVDDSTVIRSVLSKWISEVPELSVVATHVNGRRAADDVVRAQPDVIILDIEMPEMDGLTALPLILERKPGTIVLVASTLTRRGAEVSLRALTLGAADYIAKPDALAGMKSSEEFRQDIVTKVKQLGARGRIRHRAAEPSAASTAATTAVPAAAKPAPAAKLRSYSRSAIPALVIGSSTGGPQALNKVLTAIGPMMAKVPVLITQHMPPTFTAILAEHMARASGRPAKEGQHGEPLEPGHVYVAPGGHHMIVARSGGRVVTKITDDPPVNFCRPAVDTLFFSAAEVFGAGLLGVVLTGMGADGAKGSVAIADAGGSIIAQDEASSVVWGMPGATVAAGAACDVLPLDDVGRKVARMLSGGRL
ncbi:protein-glutamate methylesterase/protein-glutamine glutaminase [Amorphus sp. MBR-141]